MAKVSRRAAVMATGGAFASALTACGTDEDKSGDTGGDGVPKPSAKATPIGDGSTADTGPATEPAEAARTDGHFYAPPQFVVFMGRRRRTDDHMPDALPAGRTRSVAR